MNKLRCQKEIKLRRPQGCKCKPFDWQHYVPPICNKYEEDIGEICLRCMHDKACHVGEGK